MSTPESLFADWLERLTSAEPLDLEELIREHPEHEAAVRELHRQWVRMEALMRQRFHLSGSFADRLAVAHGSDVDPKVLLSTADAGELPDGLVGRLSTRTPASTRYRAEGELARGGMGAVIAVWDEDLRRRLAMKVLLEHDEPRDALEARREKQLLARLLEEAQVTAQLDHPGIVPVHELGLSEDGQVYFTMKLVRGETLASVFDELAAGGGEWSRIRALGLLVRVCEAMSYAHAKGVIHRDLKPANVMVGKFGETYVMDWGLAKVLGRDDDKDVRIRPEAGQTTGHVRSDRRDQAGETPDSPLLTMDGDVVGTPAYMSPEQASGRISEMGPPSDVYALGAMLYHLLAGHMPYVPRGARPNNYAVWQRVQEGPPRPLHEVAHDAPPELVAICERAMAREARDRYPDMGAVARDLSAYVEGRVVSAFESGPWAEAKKWIRRNKALAASMSAAAVLLVVGLVTAIHLGGEARASAAAERARAEDVLRLSALRDHDVLIARAEELWPPHPENLTAFDDWIRRARELAADLPLHIAKREELRQRALPRSDAEREADRRAHPDFGSLTSLTSRVASARTALRQRRDGVAPDPYELDRSRLPAEAKALDDLAWALVRPDRDVFGREAEGLAIADLGLELATDARVVATLQETRAHALFCLGRDAESVSAVEAAIEAAPTEVRASIEGRTATLREWIETVSSAEGRAAAEEELAALEEQRVELSRRVEERRTWNFEDTPAGREASWWHENLTKLIDSLAALVDEGAGLLSERDSAVSPQHGWSVVRRANLAERIRSELAPGTVWSGRWDRAIAAIREHPSYGGLELDRRLGLVPIGADPESGLWEFWHVASGDEPLRDAAGRLRLTEETGIVLVLVPGGTFWMGSSADPEAPHNHDRQAILPEGPVHRVTLSPFMISKYEMTQGQWSRFTGSNPSYYPPSEDVVESLLHPVEQVSWLDARRVLSRMGLQLPSEAQWEMACRAGTETPWYFGKDREALRGRINIADKSAIDGGAGSIDANDWPEHEDGGVLHREVGSYPPNRFGLHEVHGNVWEWCVDGYDWRAYRDGREVDPVTPWEGARNCVVRGGAFAGTAGDARSAHRNFTTPSTAAGNLGVRPALRTVQ